MSTSMTRQHFNAIAETIATTPGLSAAQRETLADRMATALRPFNNRFNQDRFIRVATTVPAWVTGVSGPYVASPDETPADVSMRHALDRVGAFDGSIGERAYPELPVNRPSFDARTYWADPANRTVTGHQN